MQRKKINYPHKLLYVCEFMLTCYVLTQRQLNAELEERTASLIKEAEEVMVILEPLLQL